MVAAVGYVEATRRQRLLCSLKELQGGEVGWCLVASKDIADDDVAAGRKEPLGFCAGLAGTDFDGGGTGDVEKRTHQLAQLGVEFDHRVAAAWKLAGEVARKGASRAA